MKWLKYFAISIIINIMILYLFYIFVAEPIKVVSQIMAKNWCQSLQIKCIFKDLK